MLRATPQIRGRHACSYRCLAGCLHPCRQAWTSVRGSADDGGELGRYTGRDDVRDPGGRAFDGERVVPGGALVLVDHGRIAGVEPGAAPAPEGCQVLEAPGGGHAHLAGHPRI